MGELNGRVALVTGASAGLGAAVAEALAGAGARVVVLARRAEQLEEVAAGIDGAAVTCDLLDRQALAQAVPRVSAPFGPPDIVVHAAGVNPRRPASGLSEMDWERTLSLNLTAPFLLTRALVPAMRRRSWGRVLLIASLQSSRAFQHGMPYGASKGGIAQLTRAMALEWGSDGITVNAIAPGFFPTELTAPLVADPDAWGALAGRTCLGRNGELADLHGPAVFLCSDASAYVTGQILHVDGGFSAR